MTTEQPTTAATTRTRSTPRRSRSANPAGSSSALRADVLRVLGVVKVGTADQVQRLTAPHLTYRHTTKTEAAAREARTRPHRAAAQDLVRQGLLTEAGYARTGAKLWSLTPAGLEAAAEVLDRPLADMGGLARGAGRTGATHALAVTEAIWALIRPAPDMSRLTGAPGEDPTAAAAQRPGLGQLEEWRTEVPLPMHGTTSAGRGGVQADAALTAPGERIPLLFLEVDNGHMSPDRIASKVDRYDAFYRRASPSPTGSGRTPMWHQLWPDAATHYRRRDWLPPLLLVLNDHGRRDPVTTADRVFDLTYQHWHRRIPLVAVHGAALAARGPHEPVFLRAGRDHSEPLLRALSDWPADEATAHRVEDDRRQKAARPYCPDCGRQHDRTGADQRCLTCALARGVADWQAADQRREAEEARAAQETEEARAAEEAEAAARRGWWRRR